MADQKEFTQTQIRLPSPLYEELKESADRNFRSMNGELLYWIQVGLGRATQPLSAEDTRRIVSEELARSKKTD